MTVKLLCDYPPYKAGNLFTSDSNTEAGLVAQHVAQTDLTGGTTYVPTPIVQRGIARARTAAQLAAAPTVADLSMDGEFYLNTDPTQRYVINAAGTAYATFGGGGGSSAFSALTGAPTDNTALATSLAAKQNIPQNWTGTVPALASSTDPVPAFGSNTFVYTGAGGATLNGNVFQTGDVAVFGSGVWAKYVYGGGYVGTAASTSALETAYPHATNLACTAFVGGVLYIATAAGWAMTDGATFSALIAANTAALSVMTDNGQTGTTYTFVLADAGQNVDLSNAAPITATIPPNSSVPYPIGTILGWTQAGAGAVTIAPGAAVTLNKRSTYSLTTSEQLATGYARKTATDTWRVYNG